MTLSRKEIAAARAVYEAYWESYFTGNIEAFATTIDEAFSIIGTSEGEISFGKENVAAMYEAQFEEIVGKAEVRNRQVREIPTGDMLQIIEFSDIYVLVDSDWSFYSKFRLSTLLHKTPDGWKLLQQHGSLPDMRVGEGETVAVEKISKENLELRDAIKRRTVELENKSRDLEIEAALERVRSRSMAMHNSDELAEVIQVVYDQFVGLKIPVDHAGFILDYKEREDMHIWLADHQKGVPSEITIPYFDSPHWNSFVDAKSKGESFFANLLNFEEKNKFYKDLMELIPPMPEETIQNIYKKPGLTISTVLLENVGLYIEHYSNTPFTDEDNTTLMRFGRVFQQTYTRFLDLKKAEAQAREAQIEAALEKVRSRSLAMQNSDELNDVVSIVFEKIKELNIPATAVGIGIAISDSKDLDSYVCGENEDGLVITNYRLPYFDNIISKDLVKALEDQLEYFVGSYSKEEKNSFYEQLFEHSAIKDVPEDIKQMIFESPNYTISMMAVKNALWNINDFEGKQLSDSDIAIIKRFTRVFEQAYTRFLDLQKAEAQAREAKIETALEKVRSRTMGMQKSDELADVADVLFKEMNNLVHNLWTCGFVLCEKDREEDEWWLGLEEGFTRGFFLPNVNDFAHAHLYEGWLKKDEFRTVQLEDDKLQAHYDWLMEIPVAKNIFDEMEAAGMQRPEWQKLHAAYFSKGYLVIITREPCPEEAIFKRFAQVFDLTYTRFLDLQKAEAQAREAQIENALEKVRSRSLAMQNPDELIEVAELLREEMGALGVEELETSSIYIHDDSTNLTQCWFTIKDADYQDKSVTDQMTINLQDTWVGQEMLEFYRSGTKQTSVKMMGDRRIEWIRYCGEKSNLFTPDRFYGDSIPERTYHLYKFSNGYIGAASPGEISDESWDLLRRATSVFSFAYTRFMDLKKAKEQTREAQIELSLERIRAQVTSMQESSDLLDIVVAMRTEFVNLGHEAHYFWHMRWLPDTYAKAMTSGDGTKIGMVMTLPRHIHGDIPAVARWEKSNEPTHVLAMDIETAVDYVDKMITLGDFERVDPQAPSLDDIRHIGGLTFVMARTTHGEIGFSLPGVVENPPKDSVDTLMRFAGVFDLAYRRFEDLKKAEYQRRETEIELALERTRTQSMLMQHSDEITKISQVFHQQLLTLNIPSEFSYVWLPDESKNNHQFWASWAEETEGGLNFSSKQVTYPLDKTEPYTAACYQAWSKPDRVHQEFIPPSDISDFFGTWAELLDGAQNLKANNFKKGIYYSEAYMSYGCFGINIRRELSDEEKRVLKRFSTEFERAYTRFLDLQKAEAQAREAQIEAALEKVRSRSLAMQKSDELLAVIIELSSQLQQLNVRFDFVSFGVIGQENEIDFWMAGEGYTQPELYHMPYFDHFVTNSLLEDQKKGLRFSESTFNQKDTREWMEVLFENNPKSKMLADTKKHTRTGPGMVRASVILKNICVFMGNFRLKPHSKEQNALLIRFANAFEQAYTRFLDLQKAEAQAEQAEENLKTIKAARAKAEEALIELKAAQNQLIQAEKLASLGQLTAGIAHEIKNPLNFVNNFSELNVELIDEVFEELEKLEASESSELMAEILEDVKSNLTKIHEHGTRADGIVKSMLQHSRGSSGKIEPTNLNSLIKEYTNLAFHGMRAGKNPINVEIDLQLDSSITDIPLISEDFTRVILNLCNNAFDAMRETESQRSPKLTVRTQKTDKHISIEVGDNGSGIPDDIKEKILQPFFTTKKGTDGTGLGLSITNDIIKAHGGEITIDSSQGKGTTFSINLAIKGQ